MNEEVLRLAAVAARDEHIESSSHDARIFTAEEMDDLWANMIHVNAGEELDTFKYAPWMQPLSQIYRENYTVHPHANEVIHECEQAYKAGLAGDLGAVDRFVGGFELSKLETTSLMIWYPTRATVLDLLGGDGIMLQPIPNEVNSGKRETNDDQSSYSGNAGNQRSPSNSWAVEN